MKETPVYNDRVWLNDDHSPSTGSIVCYDGPANWGSRSAEREEESFIEVADCGNKARLHICRYDTSEQFIEKITKMRDALNRYLAHLKTRKTEYKDGEKVPVKSQD